MKGYSDFELASLILHEQTHATLFVKGQTQFSEELASFVGEEGALAWLAESRGSDELREAREQIADALAFGSLVRGLHAELEELYRSALDREQKLKRKSALIASFRADFEREKQTLFRTEAYHAMGAPQVNNAWLSLFSLYADDLPLIRSYCDKLCGGDLRRLLAQARVLARQGDIKVQMRRALAGDWEA
jgi:predicted aminopeptidase